jgi:bifunctional non-homologous end joining protein LigD
MGRIRLDSPWPAVVYTRMLLRSVTPPEQLHRTLPPQPGAKTPAGAGWIHEIKLDGFRLLARRDAARVRRLTRRGIDWTNRYPTIAVAVATLSCRSCLIRWRGGDLRRGRRSRVRPPALRSPTASRGRAVPFDLLELAGKDLCRTPVEERKQVLGKLLRKSSWALQLNEHIVESGDIVFRHACKLGFEGIVSKLALCLRSLATLG